MSAPLARWAWQLSELTKISILCLKHRSFEGYMLHSGSHFLDMCQNVWNMAHLYFSGCGSTVKDRNGRKWGRGSKRQPPGLLLNASHLLIRRTNGKLCTLIRNSAQAFLSKYIHIGHCTIHRYMTRLSLFFFCLKELMKTMSLCDASCADVSVTQPQEADQYREWQQPKAPSETLLTHFNHVGWVCLYCTAAVHYLRNGH